MSWLDRDGNERTWSLTAWPTGSSLVSWLGEQNVSSKVGTVIADDLALEATDVILGRIAQNRLPADSTQCPRVLSRAIVLESARLLSRKDSAQGIVAFGDLAMALRQVDVDIADLLRGWRPTLVA